MGILKISGSFAAILAVLSAAVDPALRAGEAGRTLHIVSPASYLPGIPVLLRIEVRRADGSVDRDLWDGEALLAARPEGAAVSPDRIVLRNGLGSALVSVTPAAPGEAIEIEASLGGLRADRVLASLEGVAAADRQGALPSGLTEWGGIIRVIGPVTVPAGATLRILPGTLVLVDGVLTRDGQPGECVSTADTPAKCGTSIAVKGAVECLGTEAEPVVITARDPARAWGEIRHDGAAPSLYRHTILTRAGNSPRGGHTATGPAIRAIGSRIDFESCSIADTKGKTLQATGSDLLFRDCLLARSIMGPEIDGTAILFDRSWAVEMAGTDDNDAIYLHGQRAGQEITLRGSVFAACDDDGIDTLGSDVTIEDCIVRDIHGADADAKGISVLAGEVTVSRCLLVENEVGISAKGSASEGGASVRIDRTTIVGTTVEGPSGPEPQVGIQAEDKYGVPDLRILYDVENSIIRAPIPVRSDYLERFPDDIGILYSALSAPWPGTGNIVADPLFADPAAGDYRLGPGSPCIDAGDPASPSDPDGSRADMGRFSGLLTADPAFIRGLVNGDGDVDIGDPITILLHLFGGIGLPCREAADADDNGAVDLSDPIRLLGYLFLDGSPLPSPAGACGPDPTPDGLDCASASCP